LVLALALMTLVLPEPSLLLVPWVLQQDVQWRMGTAAVLRPRL
jgi:hypothetical protein